MGWLWKSKAEKQHEEELAEQVASLQAQVDELQSQNAESSRRQSELQDSLTAAQMQCDANLEESERSMAAVNGQNQHLTNSLQQLSASLLEVKEQHRLLDEANSTMGAMLRERDQKIEDFEQVSAAERKERDATIDQQAQSLKEQEAKISELLQAASKAREVEQKLSTEVSAAQAQLAKLQQELAASEARSARRADQRTALLKNLAEIHRLSQTSSANQPPPESLKLVSPGWSESADDTSSIAKTDSESPNSLYSRSGT